MPNISEIEDELSNLMKNKINIEADMSKKKKIKEKFDNYLKLQ